MPSLFAYRNVENTALVLLGQRGYQCWCDPPADYCYAEKEGWDFRAGNWVELLGIVAIFETLKPEEYREYWWRINEPWLLDDVPLEPQPYNTVWGGPRD